MKPPCVVGTGFRRQSRTKSIRSEKASPCYITTVTLYDACARKLLHVMRARSVDKTRVRKSPNPSEHLQKFYMRLSTSFVNMTSFYVPQQTRDEVLQHRKSKVIVSVRYSSKAIRLYTTGQALWQRLELSRRQLRVLHTTRNVW